MAPHAVIALDLDGVYFCDLRADAQGATRLAFPFSPSGHSQMSFCPRLTRDGEPLIDAAIGVEFDVAGLRTACAPIALAPLDIPTPLIDPRELQREVAIIIPIYNAAAAVERCIASVLLHTTGNTRLILIDDASTESEITPLLERHIDRLGVEVLRNESNLGFTATVNRGMRHAPDAEVVLLNADTEVGPNWLDGLRRAAYSQPDIASATAVSDNAGAFSVPELERENPWPSPWNFAQAARALWQDAGTGYPCLPTGNGFCMYIRRNVLEAVGLFDAEAFPQGYGEENDFSQRASATGLRHVIAGNVLVHHERSLSFGVERREALGHRGMQVLRERWPNYESDVGATLFSFERRALDWRVRRLYAAAETSAPPLPRVLRLAATNNRAQHDDFDIWHLAVLNEMFVLTRDTDNGTVIVEHAPLTSDSAPILRQWMARHAFEVADCAIEADEFAAQVFLTAAKDLGLANLLSPAQGTIDSSYYNAACARMRSFAENQA